MSYTEIKRKLIRAADLIERGENRLAHALIGTLGGKGLCKMDIVAIIPTDTWQKHVMWGREQVSAGTL